MGPVSSAKSRMSVLLQSFAFFGPCGVIRIGESEEGSPTFVIAAMIELMKDPNDVGLRETFDEATIERAFTN